MPPYYSIFFSLEEYSSQRCISLSSIYKALFTNDFVFKDKYSTENKEISNNYQQNLESIISWNQKIFNKNFRLGWTQHQREDYQQFLLKHPLFNHCRVITSSKYISLIIPEYEVTLSNSEYYTSFESLNIKLIQPCIDLAIDVWSTGLLTSVQTSPENGYFSSYKDLIQGQLPFICPFAILDKNCFYKMKHFHPNLRITAKEISRGFLIESRAAIYGR